MSNKSEINNQDSKTITFHYSIRDVAPYINWVYYFHAWGMEPRFATIANIHDCTACRTAWITSFPANEQSKAREAMHLYDEAKGLLRLWADEPICHALFRLANAYSAGDDIIVDNHIRLPFLRQQHTGKSGHTLCLSDFIKPSPRLYEKGSLDIANTIGIFATTTSVPTLHQPSNTDIQFSTLADRLAEATAEKLHQEVRRHYWGYAPDEELSMNDLHAERFQGIRPAVGYPSLPDLSINFLIDRLLTLCSIGITLTESGAMSPHSSVSGLMFAHPKSHYFSVGHIDEDQLTDYAQRRGLSTEQIRKFLIGQI